MNFICIFLKTKDEVYVCFWLCMLFCDLYSQIFSSLSCTVLGIEIMALQIFTSILSLSLCVHFFFFIWDKVTLHILCWSGACNVLACSPHLLVLQVCITASYFKHILLIDFLNIDLWEFFYQQIDMSDVNMCTIDSFCFLLCE